MKICLHCVREKSPTEFPKGRNVCKDCRRLQKRLSVQAYKTRGYPLPPLKLNADEVKERNRATSRRYYHRHAEAEKAKSIAWQRANRERAQAINAEASRQYRSRNPERIRDTWLRRRAERNNADRGSPLTQAETSAYRSILLGDPCSYCGSPAAHIDHIDALSRGGADVWANLTAACATCNVRKHTKSLLTWLVDG